MQQSAKFIEENGGEEWLYCLRDKKYKESKTELMKLCGVGAKVRTTKLYLSLVVRKPVFGVSDQVRHKPGCAATDDR